MKKFLAWLSAQLIWLIGSSLRVTVEDRGGIVNKPDHQPVIIAFWHNRVAMMAYFHWLYSPGNSALTFISRSRDGQFITDVAAKFRIKAVRGSSSRHGMAASLAAVKAAEDPHIDIVITPDGPRGPRYEIQPGLIRLAQMTGRPIVAVTYQLRWKYELRSWDRFHIPIPFSICNLKTSEPVFIHKDASEDDKNAIRQRISDALGGD